MTKDAAGETCGQESPSVDGESGFLCEEPKGHKGDHRVAVEWPQ